MLADVLDYMKVIAIRGDIASITSLTVNLLRGNSKKAVIVNLICCRMELARNWLTRFQVCNAIRTNFKNLERFKLVSPSKFRITQAARPGITIVANTRWKIEMQSRLDEAMQNMLMNLHSGKYDATMRQNWVELTTVTPNAQLLISRVGALSVVDL